MTTTKTGKLPFRLMNDYLFRAVFQSHPKALEGLCRAVLHLLPQDTIKVTLKNPIELGKKLENKEFILDLAVVINNSLFLNLEMQASSQPYWPERALSYTCRSYHNLNHGESYNNVLPVHHIGFLGFTLFPEHPEFFADYRLVNVNGWKERNQDGAPTRLPKQLRSRPENRSAYRSSNRPANPQIFSDKLRISVIDLTQIKLATEEDKQYQVDLWAHVLTATTWEEIDMLSQNNEYLKETVAAVEQLTEDEQIRQMCQAREDFEYWERIKNNYYRQEIQTRDEALQKKDEELQKKDKALQQQTYAIQQKDEEIARLLAELETLKKQ